MFRRTPAGPQVGRAETEAPQVPLAAEQRTDYAVGGTWKKGTSDPRKTVAQGGSPRTQGKKARAF